jgi:UDP-N-acetyl-2-amino-2-deoxyglucuronate dehydrogenase
MIHVGLIGAGNISDTHARAAAAIPNVTIAAVYAPTATHAQRLAKRHGAVAYDTLDGLLRHQPLTMVAIGSPSGLHAEQGIAAAKRGLHVLVEKPLDVTTARVDALVAEAAQAGVTLGVIFQDRLKPGVQQLKAVVDAGRLGAPILATAHVKWYRPPSYYRESRWRGTKTLDGGGALMNQGIHTVDLLQWIFGPVHRVFARTAAKLHDIEVEDTAVAVLEFESGALGTLEAATSAYPGYSRRIELTGANGTLILDGDALSAIDLHDASDDERPVAGGASTVVRIVGKVRDAARKKVTGRPAQERPAARATVSAASPVVADASAHQRVFEDFIRAVAQRTAPCCDGRSGRESVALVEAIYTSARSDRPVAL